LKLFNTDQLMVMEVDDLKRLILSLRSNIKELEDGTSNSSDELVELQTYYCYVYRELEHRGLK
jgi:hypothetical protein